MKAEEINGRLVLKKFEHIGLCDLDDLDYIELENLTNYIVKYKLKDSEEKLINKLG